MIKEPVFSREMFFLRKSYVTKVQSYGFFGFLWSPNLIIDKTSETFPGEIYLGIFWTRPIVSEITVGKSQSSTSLKFSGKKKLGSRQIQ